MIAFNKSLDRLKYHFVLLNKQHHMEALLTSFQLYGHTLDHSTDSKDRTTLYSVINSTIRKQ